MTEKLTEQEVDAFFSAHPDATGIDMLIPDLSGVLRGKRIARDGVSKLYKDGVRLPRSSYLLDTTGQNCETLEYGSRDTDPDFPCFGIAGTLQPVPWAEAPAGQVIASMVNEDGSPMFCDPRQVLAKAMSPLTEMGLTPVVALELEFYLLDNRLGRDGIARLAKSESMQRRQTMTQCYGIEELYEYEGFLNDVTAACKAQNIPADTAISEYGPGQYEINLNHVADPMKACDDAVLLKRAIKAIARKHGFCASFMAKPFAELSGCGMHIHASLLDRDGNNFFAGPMDEEIGFPVAESLRHAIGGLKQTMAEGMAIFAPNANSYRRFKAGAYAPVNTAWSANNRTVSLRIPHCDAKSARVEHRPAGADANPYLVMACMLAGLHHGISNRIDPGPMKQGDAYADPSDDLPLRWEKALEVFEEGQVLKTYLGEHYHEVFAANRRFECDNFHEVISALDYEWYMRTV